jgi:hypothetical protein
LPFPAAPSSGDKPPLAPPTIKSLSLKVTGCGPSAAAPSITATAGRLEVLQASAKGAEPMAAFGLPKGGATLRLQVAGGALPGPDACEFPKISLKADAEQDASFSRKALKRINTCLAALQPKFKCDGSVRLQAQLRGNTPKSKSALYSAGEWSAPFEFTPTCQGAGAACFP